MSLNGIDIASYQSSINISALTTTDFVIVKATQGTSYTNPYFTKHIEEAIKAGKRVGAYHYANGVGAEKEAKYFLSAVKPYLGKILLALDWETGSSSAAKNTAVDNVSYAKTWLDYVKKESGITPIIYMSRSMAANKDWSSVASDYKLWGAQYKNYTAMDYTTDPWMSGTWGAWGSKPYMFQYTSSGSITGYSASLDLDLFYGSGADWDAMVAAGGTDSSENTYEGWVKNDTGWWYRYSDGTWPASELKTIDGYLYYFNSEGYLVTDTSWTYNGVTYTADSNGRITQSEEAATMAKKFVNKNGRTYVYADTTLKTKTGSLNAKEECLCLDVVNKRYLVLYKVDGTDSYKVGFVNYNGLV